MIFLQYTFSKPYSRKGNDLPPWIFFSSYTSTSDQHVKFSSLLLSPRSIPDFLIPDLSRPSVFHCRCLVYHLQKLLDLQSHLEHQPCLKRTKNSTECMFLFYSGSKNREWFLNFSLLIQLNCWRKKEGSVCFLEARQIGCYWGRIMPQQQALGWRFPSLCNRCK